MTCHKLVLKCGSFAILVDFRITPEGSSKDTQWFPHHRREEVCMLLRGAVELRVEQYLEAHKRHGQGKQQLESAQDTLFSLEGDGLYITAYFVKRWERLQCILGQQYRELRVFPDRFVICVTRLESSSPLCMREYVAPKEELSAGTSEYFGKPEDEKCRISLTQEKKKDTLKKIVKRTKTKRANKSKPQPSKDTVEVYLGSLHSDRE